MGMGSDGADPRLAAPDKRSEKARSGRTWSADTPTNRRRFARRSRRRSDGEFRAHFACVHETRPLSLVLRPKDSR